MKIQNKFYNQNYFEFFNVKCDVKNISLNKKVYR